MANSLFTLAGIEAEITRVQELIETLQGLIDTAVADTTEFTVTEERVGQASLKTGGAGTSYVGSLQKQIVDLTTHLQWLCKRHLQITTKSVSTLEDWRTEPTTSGAKFGDM